MPQVLDQCGDVNGQRLYRLCTLVEQPTFVKDASSEAVYGHDKLPARCFADQARRQFPLHTKAATWISYGFLMDTKDQIDSDHFELLREGLRKAAAFHGIKAELDCLDAKFQKDADETLSEDDFALTIQVKNGATEKRYPIRNAKEVKAAADYLRTHRDALPYYARRQMAERILTKAATYAADIRENRDFLEKQAGWGYCAATDVAKLLNDRAILVRRNAPEIADLLQKAAATALEQGGSVREQENLQALAETVDSIDRRYGLCDYGPGSPRPEDVLFGVTTKTAEQYVTENFLSPSGRIYRIDDLNHIKLADIRNLLGDEIADSSSAAGLQLDPDKLAKRAHMMSPRESELLEHLLERSGIAPVAKDTSLHGSWLTQDVLQDLAKV